MKNCDLSIFASPLIPMENCLFCKIIKKEIPAEFVYESDLVVAFPDIHPSADEHILIVPKRHVRGISSKGRPASGWGELLVEIYKVVEKLVIEFNLSKYRVVVNGGSAQQIPHLHFHLLGGTWKKMV